jgi:hypothetical protein
MLAAWAYGHRSSAWGTASDRAWSWHSAPLGIVTCLLETWLSLVNIGLLAQAISGLGY